MGCLGAVLGRLGAVLGRPWGHLGASWVGLGNVLGRLGAPPGRPKAPPGSILTLPVAIGRPPEIIKKPVVFIAFLMLGALLGTSRSRLGTILVPSWRVLWHLRASVASSSPPWHHFCSLWGVPSTLQATFGSLLALFRPLVEPRGV